MRKKPDPAILPLAAKMFAEGIKAAEACAKAGVAPSTWSRWTGGGVPHLPTLRKLEDAVDAIIADEMVT